MEKQKLDDIQRGINITLSIIGFIIFCGILKVCNEPTPKRTREQIVKANFPEGGVNVAANVHLLMKVRNKDKFEVTGTVYKIISPTEVLVMVGYKTENRFGGIDKCKTTLILDSLAEKVINEISTECE